MNLDYLIRKILKEELAKSQKNLAVTWGHRGQSPDRKKNRPGLEVSP